MTQSEVASLLRTAVYIVVGIPIPAGAAAAVFFLPHSRLAHQSFAGSTNAHCPWGLRLRPVLQAQPCHLLMKVFVSATCPAISVSADTYTSAQDLHAECRRSETEADSIGMRLAAKACYDPSAAGAHCLNIHHVSYLSH